MSKRTKIVTFCLFISIILVVFSPAKEIIWNHLQYINDRSKDEHQEVLDFITDQFDIYKEQGISLKQLEAFQNLSQGDKIKLGLCRIQIINGKIYAQSNISNRFPSASLGMFQVLIAAISRTLKNYEIGNIDFIFFAVDNLEASDTTYDLIVNSPTFLMSKDLSSPLERERLLIPDAYIMTNKVWPKLINEIYKGSNIHTWNKKNSQQVFWRGATTGGTYNLENYSELPRLSLVMMSKSFPSMIDARFMHYDQFSEDRSGTNLYNILNRIFDNPGFLKEADHLKYKYLISIDGNTAAWLRVPWILLSNSVLLKQETSVTEIFYPAMKPYVHYVPLRADLSDIFEKLRWLQSNDEQARKISQNATRFVEENLLTKNMDEYLALIFKEYYKLQRFKLDKPSLPQIEIIPDV